jgi:hypothetical protein
MEERDGQQTLLMSFATENALDFEIRSGTSTVVNNLQRPSIADSAQKPCPNA